MKFKIAISILSVAVMICACDSAPQHQPSNTNTSQGGGTDTKPGNTTKGYRFNSASEKCDTFQRLYNSEPEMCLGIEVDSNNNNCALAERQAYYKSTCKGATKWYPNWRPDLAELQIKNTNGSYVTCSLEETDVPQITQIGSGRIMNMEAIASKATITHAVKQGKVTLVLDLYSTLTNSHIGHKVGITQDSIEPVVLSVQNAVGSPVLTCVVSLAQKP